MSVSLGLPRLRSTGPGPSGAPAGAGLMDRHGRRATDLRLSVIDKCNLRCTYCMPAGGLPWLPAAQLMTPAEITRIVRVGVEQLGVTELRLTGGEPLVRADLEDIIAGIRATHPDLPVSLTTNGIGLAARAQGLAEAGLTRINISLDSLDAATFRTLARRDRLTEVLAGAEAAAAAGLSPVKINAVLMRGINDHEAPDLVEWAVARGFELRFIEQMPLDAQHAWDPESMVSAAEVHELLARRFTLTPLPEADRGSAPAERFLVDGGPATVGIIASVTRPFCGACDRTRLTADGQVRNCLFSRRETDLRGPLRAGASDEELAALINDEMWVKAPGHGIGMAGFTQPDRPMSAIGG